VMFARATVPLPSTGRSQAKPLSPLGSTVGSGVPAADGWGEGCDAGALDAGLLLAATDEPALESAVGLPQAASSSVIASQARPETVWCT